MNESRWLNWKLPIIINTILACLFLIFWINSIRSGITWQADFSNYYTGWTIIHAGEGAQLYDLATQTRYQHAILGAGREFADGLLPFVSPPHWAWQGVILTFFSLKQAYLIWGVINLILLVMILRWVWQQTTAFGWSQSARLATVTAIAGFFPLQTAFLLGSFALLSVLCLIKAFDADGKQRPQIAAFWFLLATIRFQYVIFLAIWLIATRRWRVIQWAVIYGALLGLITTAILGWRIWGDYLQLLSFHNQSFNRFGIYPAQSYTLKGTLSLLLGRNYTHPIQLISQSIFVVSALGIGWFLWRNPNREPSNRYWEYGLVILLNLLLSLHLNHHDALLLVIPALFFAFYLDQQQRLSFNYVAFILSCPLLFFVTDVAIGTKLGIQIPFILMIGLLGWMIVSYYKKPRDNHEITS